MDANPTNTDVSDCCGCAQRNRRIAQLEQQNALLDSRIKQLEQRLEELSRSAKRQAAPFSRGFPKVDPKKPGRKSGDDYGTQAFRAVPPIIDETHDAPLPGRCPRCGNNAFIDEHVEQQYQAEIPRRPIYRQFNVAVARCTCCGKRVQGRHPLQTSDALGCCSSQIGPEAQAAVVMLNKELGLSQGKISRFFQMLFGIKLTRGGSCQHRAGTSGTEHCQENYQAIVKRVQHSDWVVPDETGWRVGGALAWLHVAVTQDAVAYLIARQRGYEASSKLIGEDYQGTITHDGYASYDGYTLALHQTCIGHLLRRCHELLEFATRGAVIFPRKIKTLLQEALAAGNLRDAGKIAPSAAAAKADELENQMQSLLTPTRSNILNERFARHLWEHASQLFTFLKFPGIDPTNYLAEQAIRPAVVNRKVWGGNRTQNGAMAQSILMSIIFTAARQGRDAMEFMSQMLRSMRGNRPMLLRSTG